MGSGGGSDHFCLRWNNFHSNIASSFVQLRDHEDFVDVTLACEGHTIKAHKVVLSACSPYFRNLLKQNPCQHPIIILRDVAFADVSALLSFVYQGEVYVSHDRLTAFLHTAELLHIKGLTDQHHHSTASTTHSGSNSSTNKNTDNSGSKENIGSIAVSLQASSSGGATLPVPQLIAAAPQQPPTPLQQGPLPAGRGVPCSPSPTRPQCSPSPPQPPQPFISLPLAYHHISPPPKKRRHQQQLSPVAPLSISSNVSPLSSTSSAPNTSSELSLHSVSPPLRCTDHPQVSALTVPKQEVGAALLTVGSTLAAALTAPRGERMISSGGNDTPTSGGALLLPLMVEVKQEVPESPAYTDDTSNSLCASGGGEQEAVNLVLDGSSSSNSPACSILRQRIQGYQGSPDAPPPPVYSIPRTDDEDASMDDADSKEGAGMAPPTTAVAIMRRQQHMLGLAAAAAGMYSSSAVGTTSLGSGGGTSDLVQTAQPSQDAPSPASPGGAAAVVAPGRHRWRCMQPRLCPFCWKTFSNSFNLKQHVVNVHTVGQGLQCNLCHKTVKNKWYLRKHHVTAHGAPLKRGKHAGSGSSNQQQNSELCYSKQQDMAEYHDGQEEYSETRCIMTGYEDSSTSAYTETLECAEGAVYARPSDYRDSSSSLSAHVEFGDKYSTYSHGTYTKNLKKTQSKLSLSSCTSTQISFTSSSNNSDSSKLVPSLGNMGSVPSPSHISSLEATENSDETVNSQSNYRQQPSLPSISHGQQQSSPLSHDQQIFQQPSSPPLSHEQEISSPSLSSHGRQLLSPSLNHGQQTPSLPLSHNASSLSLSDDLEAVVACNRLL